MIEAPPWIICRQALPEYGERVLLCYSLRGAPQNRGVLIGSRARTDAKGEHWWSDNNEDMDRTRIINAWMPLPKVTFES